MYLKVFSNGYLPNTMFVIWQELSNQFTHYYVYRDNSLIATVTEDTFKDFPFPERFDLDKHTRLFFKKSMHERMYVDTDVQKHRTYTYRVIARQITEDGVIVQEFKTPSMSAEVNG